MFYSVLVDNLLPVGNVKNKNVLNILNRRGNKKICPVANSFAA